MEADIKKIYFAGTIAFPPEHQGYGKVSVFSTGSRKSMVAYIKVEQELSHAVTIARTFFQDDVKAVLELPTQGTDCANDGIWHVGRAEVDKWVDNILDATGDEVKTCKAIIYVSEQAQSLLETKAALTAAECAEYYPPMPQKSSRGSQYTIGKTGCLVDDPYPTNPPVTPPGCPGGP